MIEMISKNGKRIAKISDSVGEEDILYMDGKPVPLADVYDNDSLRLKINDSIKDKNDTTEPTNK